MDTRSFAEPEGIAKPTELPSAEDSKGVMADPPKVNDQIFFR